MTGPEVPMCSAMSRPTRPGNPQSYFICTQDRGHGGMYHSACDGRGNILARWLPSSVERYYTPGDCADHDHRHGAAS